MSWNYIPEEMKKYPQWVGAGENKIPINPNNGKRASVNEPSTWGTFEQACACGAPHIGFVFTEKDPFVFIDLDTGKDPSLKFLHTEIVTKAASYTETSISGTGSHIVAKGTLEVDGMRADDKGLEVYATGRFMLMTGWQYYGDGIENSQPLLDYLSTLIQKERFVIEDLVSEESVLSDEEVWEMAANAENGEKFMALYSGQWQHYDEYQNDHSRADLALATFLDFYTKDVAQVIRLFKFSKLYRPEKGRRNGDGSDYIVRTLKGARARNAKDVPLDVDTSVLEQRAAAITKVSSPQKEDLSKEEELFLHKPEKVEMELPPGITGELAQYFYTSAIRPVKEIALIGALGLMAGVCGRQFQLKGTGLNLYLILLAATGSGKEGADNGITSIMKKVREKVPASEQFLGPSDFASGPALVKAVTNQPCFLSIMGEFGLRMQQMADPRANNAERTLQRVLLDCFGKSGWNQTLSGIHYSDTDKNTGLVHAPALSILAETTPETFFSKLTEEHVNSGLLPRFSFVEYTGKRPPINEASAYCDPSPELVNRLSDLVAQSIQLSANQACQPVLQDKEAAELLGEFNEFCDAKINSGSEIYKQLWNRAHLKALRIAAILAVGVNSLQPVITATEAKWAIDFTRQDMETIEHRFRKELIGEGEHRYESEIRKAVEYYINLPHAKRTSYKIPQSIINEPVIPYSFLRRRLRQLSGFRNDRRGTSRAIQEALRDLCDAGILQMVPPLQRKTKYGLSSDIYVIGDSW